MHDRQDFGVNRVRVITSSFIDINRHYRRGIGAVHSPRTERRFLRGLRRWWGPQTIWVRQIVDWLRAMLGELRYAREW
jgi:hypothetical protein